MSIVVAAGPVLGYNVASIAFQFLVFVFFAIALIGTALFIYAAKRFKANEGSSAE